MVRNSLSTRYGDKGGGNTPYTTKKTKETGMSSVLAVMDSCLGLLNLSSSHFLFFFLFSFGSIGSSSMSSTVVAVRCALWLFLTISLSCTSTATSHNYTHFLSFTFILWEPWAYDLAVPCWWGPTGLNQLSIAAKSELISFCFLVV